MTSVEFVYNGISDNPLSYTYLCHKLIVAGKTKIFFLKAKKKIRIEIHFLFFSCVCVCVYIYQSRFHRKISITMGPPAQSPAQMPMNAPPHHLQQNGPSHMGMAPNHMHQPMGPHGK